MARAASSGSGGRVPFGLRIAPPRHTPTTPMPLNFLRHIQRCHDTCHDVNTHTIMHTHKKTVTSYIPILCGAVIVPTVGI